MTGFLHHDSRQIRQGTGQGAVVSLGELFAAHGFQTPGQVDGHGGGAGRGDDEHIFLLAYGLLAVLLGKKGRAP